jgi:hypothetical protein
MRRNPGFAAVAILTLALGISANTAIFSLVNNIMLRKLPVRHSEQLVLLNWTSKPHGYDAWNGYADFGGCDTHDPGTGSSNCSFSYPVFDNFRTHTQLWLAKTLSGFEINSLGACLAKVTCDNTPLCYTLSDFVCPRLFAFSAPSEPVARKPVSSATARRLEAKAPPAAPDRVRQALLGLCA